MHPQNDKPTPPKPQPEPRLKHGENDQDPEFAGEAGPKGTEFSNEKSAKDLTSGEFEIVP